MVKQEFLAALEEGLSGLPREDVEEHLSFYSEMIDDRMEEGLPEEAAVAEIGPVDRIAAQIVAEIPLPRLVREKIRPNRRLQPWEIVLLVLGFPLWFPLLITGFVLILAGYIVIWALLASLWAVEVSLIAAALGGALGGVLLLFRGEGSQGLLLIGAGFILAGLAILLFFACRACTAGAVKLTKKMALGTKSLFIRKESAK